MGSLILALLASTDSDAADTLARVPMWFAEWEACLSRFDPESELSRLNRAAGRPVHVSDVLWQVLRQSLHAAQQSHGLVTPTVLDALQAAGYGRSFESLAPAASPADSAPAADWRTIQCAAATRTVCLPHGVRLDLGGIGKGWAAEQAARRLARHGAALVDAGGDIAVSGTPDRDWRWPIGVANPLDADDDLALVMVSEGAVATSGRDYRRWVRNGRLQHHIIDPRTARPAETDVLSATVIARNMSEAETASKVALILGSRAGLAWIEARRGLAGLLVLEDGRAVQSRRLEGYLWRGPEERGWSQLTPERLKR